MPIREGFYTSGAQGGAHGAFTGLQDFVHELQQQQLADRQQKRELKRQEQDKIFNEVLGRVKSGDATPEEAESQTGVPRKQFQPFVPSMESSMAKLNTELKPDTTDEEAAVLMGGIAPMRQPPQHIQTGSPFVGPGSITDPNSVAVKVHNLLEAKRNEDATDVKKYPITKIGETQQIGPIFGQHAVDTENGELPDMPLGGDVTKMNIYGQYNPRTKGYDERGRFPAEMSASAQGQAEGIRENEAAPGKASAQVAVENALREPRALTVASNKQAEINTETSPENVGKLATKDARITFAHQRAQDEAIQAGIPPEMSQSFVRGTLTGRNYLAFPTGTDHNIVSVVSRRMAGTPIVNQQSQSALQSVDTARANFDDIVNLLKDRLAKTYKGNILQAPQNEISRVLKSDPAIIEAFNSLAQNIQGLRAQAGQFGRITQQEINMAAGAFPKIDEPLNVMLGKRELFMKSLLNVENSILGQPKQPVGPVQR